MKQCVDCGHLKPDEDFPIAIRATGYRRTRCKPCWSERNKAAGRASYALNREPKIAKAAAYREANRPQIRARARARAAMRRLDPA